MKIRNLSLTPPVKPPFLGLTIELDRNEVEYIADNAHSDTGSSILNELTRAIKKAHRDQGVA